MLYRSEAQIALQASLHLALLPEGRVRRVHDLAEELNVGATYLAKIMQSLARVGLVRSVRGPRGGIRLARSPREIHQWDVLIAFQPAGDFERCLVGRSECSDLNPCAFHDGWVPIRSQILDMLQTRSLWEIATEATRKGVLR